MFIKTKDFLIYRPIKYCVTSMTLKLFKHDASIKSQYKFKYIFVIKLFSGPRLSPLASYTYEKMYSRNRPPTFHDSAVNRTDSSSHKKNKTATKTEGQICQSYIHGGYYMLSYNRRKLACIPCFCSQLEKKGSNKVLEGELQCYKVLT